MLHEPDPYALGFEESGDCPELSAVHLPFGFHLGVPVNHFVEKGLKPVGRKSASEKCDWKPRTPKLSAAERSLDEFFRVVRPAI